MSVALTDLQLQEVANAAADTCEAPLVDAELLFGAGRYARAHALATLAFEEFGKHVLSRSGNVAVDAAAGMLLVDSQRDRVGSAVASAT